MLLGLYARFAFWGVRSKLEVANSHVALLVLACALGPRLCRGPLLLPKLNVGDGNMSWARRNSVPVSYKYYKDCRTSELAMQRNHVLLRAGGRTQYWLLMLVEGGLQLTARCLSPALGRFC